MSKEHKESAEADRSPFGERSQRSRPRAAIGSELDEEIPQQRIRAALQEISRANLPILAGLFGGICLLQAIGDQWILAPENRLMPQLAVAICGFLFLVFRWLLEDWTVPVEAVHRTTLGFSLVLGMAMLVHLRATGDAGFSVGVYLVVATGGVLFIERRWMWAFLGTMSLGWLWVGFNVYSPDDWRRQGLFMVWALMIAVLVNAARRGTLSRLAQFRLMDQQRKAVLQERIEDAHRSTVELAELSVRDPLTGAYNRRYIDEIADDLGRPTASWGLILIDLDDFKQVNDRFGHEEGDRVLQGIAHFIRRQGRAEDRLVRYGGDEFVLIVELKSVEELDRIASRIRVNAEHEAPSSFSLGVALRQPHESFSDVLRRADDDMYREKGKALPFRRPVS